MHRLQQPGSVERTLVVIDSSVDREIYSLGDKENNVKSYQNLVEQLLLNSLILQLVLIQDHNRNHNHNLDGKV